MMQYISEYSEKDATSRFFGMVGAPITAYNGSLSTLSALIGRIPTRLLWKADIATMN